MTEQRQQPASTLKFYFGPFLVARRHLRLRLVDAAAEPEQALAPGAEPDMGELARNEEGFLFRSQPISGALARYTLTRSAVRYVPEQYERRHIDLTMSYAEYLAHFSGKTRSTLQRKQRKFAELPGGMELRTYRRPDELAEFHKEAREISRQTYQERLYDAGIPDSERFRTGMAGLAAVDSVRAYLLFLGSDPVSYLYLPARGGRLRYSFLGYRPDVAQHSPGTVLLWLALAEIFQERRFTRLDFLEGDGPAKRLFSTHAVPSANIYYLRRTTRMRGLVQCHALMESTGNRMVGLADKLGLREALRKRLRGTSGTGPASG